jgi:hypothetical protein
MEAAVGKRRTVGKAKSIRRKTHGGLHAFAIIRSRLAYHFKRQTLIASMPEKHG